ncbi:CheA signal transduction histidine kinase [Thermoanaerobacterium thermosaccharolyticum DSM 571]|jgi:two-component system chemotaxis sensor kinase CheA|uniref:Chemotaxis protein CheA n=1 Tax=Thermoanaerobacterium thermosaccharolyticum (strain ATCC 7956 / DSM 571 / NCIMB 9385 / NCA 3814 / NCTC 13789 / WDCM 00135 / 2032) TaxID=580327 RepID=D9TMM0_THETC|nr:chemotaxis protein CheA [Thermoanaerobacterium thermosaccharolyticum]ADL68946.1 CheA signal transduction histidine kinase [Thermoanaerobacterium thermosaccharolyticum DSM 571]
MDTNQYLEIFLEESEEHIESLNENLLQLEKNPEDSHIIDEIFRSAHTLKGMAATMGFENMTRLTHKMEDVLQEIRSNSIKVTSNLMDVLFKCMDALSSMTGIISESGNDSYDIENLIELLETNNSKEEVAATNIENSKSLDSNNINVYEKDIIEKAASQGYKTYSIEVVIDKNCVMKSARAFIVFNTLDNLGDIVDSTPSVEDIEDEKFDDRFTVHLISKHEKDVIKSKLMSISEIKNINIEELLYSKEIKDNKKFGPTNLGSNDQIKHSKTNKSVRVDIERLDNLMNLVSELIIIKTRLEGIESNEKNPDTISTIEYLERITTNLHDAVMKVRMVPVERVFNRFPRMVRDLSRELNKKITLNMYGQDTEVDRTVIDEIGDPLVHLMRNSIDHGIETPEVRVKKGKPETGVINLKAYHEGNNVIIEVSDDGSGINFEKVKNKAYEKGMLSADEVEELSNEKLIKLLFEPGFSTSDTISDISGRGVGLDVVKNKIESLNGSIEVKTEVDKGTKFIIKLPLTLAIIQALLVMVGNEKYAFPLNSISEIVNKNKNEIHLVQGKEVVMYRGKVIPLIRLHNILDLKSNEDSDNFICVIIKKGDNLAACSVDELIGQQEIVIKPLGKYLSNVKIIAGATILGDGQVALIIDSNNLF